MDHEQMSEPPMTQNVVSQPLSPISKKHYEESEKENDEYEDDENDIELNENNVGDLDTYYMQ
jgi:hypothetical protein